jgi:hypothetical protein
MTTSFKLVPDEKEFIETIAYPNAIYNQIEHIKQHVANTPDISKHVHSMFEYDLDDVVPSGYFCNVIDHHLEEQNVPWRIYKVHVRVDKLTGRTVIRSKSLVDLAQPPVELPDHMLEVYRVMAAYAKQYDEPIITRASALAAFKLPEDKGYYWVFIRYFDVWEYSDLHPEIGWRKCEGSIK